MAFRCKALAATACAVATIGASAPLATAHAAGPALVGEWRFDESGGTVVRDTSGSQLDGRLDTGGAQPLRIPGIEGGALHFDGGDAVLLPDSKLLEPDLITVAAWVRAPASPGTFRYIVSKGAAGCRTSSYGLYTGPGGNARFYVLGAGHYVRSPAADAASLWDGRWHRLTGVYDGKSVSLYLDGVQVGHGSSFTGDIRYDLAGGAAFIGTYQGTCTLPFTGDIDRVSIWDGALTPAQVTADAQPPASPPTGGGGGSAGGTPGGSGGKPVGSGGSGGSGGTGTGPTRGHAPRCTSVTVNRRKLRAGHRARLVVTVRTAGRARRHVRVVVSARRLHRASHTGHRGRVTFRVRPRHSQRELLVRARVARVSGCSAPTARVRVGR